MFYGAVSIFSSGKKTVRHLLITQLLGHTFTYTILKHAIFSYLKECQS